MNQEFDCNQLFAEFNHCYLNNNEFDQKVSSSIALGSSTCTEVKTQEQILNYFTLEMQEPKEVNHIWFDNQQENIIDKIMGIARKDTADGDQICKEDIGNSRRRRKEDKEIHTNQTKNIPKNFGKAILAFMQKYKKATKSVLEKYHAGSYKDFIDFLNEHKKQITTIADLRSLWLDNKYEEVLRTLSSYFLRKYSLQYIFNSRVCNYGSHIKYRQRFIEAIKTPNEFQHIKQY